MVWYARCCTSSHHTQMPHTRITRQHQQLQGRLKFKEVGFGPEGHRFNSPGKKICEKCVCLGHEWTVFLCPLHPRLKCPWAKQQTRNCSRSVLTSHTCAFIPCMDKMHNFTIQGKLHCAIIHVKNKWYFDCVCMRPWCIMPPAWAAYRCHRFHVVTSGQVRAPTHVVNVLVTSYTNNC